MQYAFNFSKIKYYTMIFLEKVQNIFLIFNNNYLFDYWDSKNYCFVILNTNLNKLYL